jgi:hypothetical protein
MLAPGTAPDSVSSHVQATTYGFSSLRDRLRDFGAGRYVLNHRGKALDRDTMLHAGFSTARFKIHTSTPAMARTVPDWFG